MNDTLVVAVVALLAQASASVVAIRTLKSLSAAAVRSAVASTPQELVYLEREAARTEQIMRSKEDPIFPIGL